MVKTIQFKVEKDRVLVPIGEPCSFGCRYCYTRGGEVGPPRAEKDEILRELRKFTEQDEFGVLQLGYDGDPFVQPERGISMLQELVKIGKNITFSTKAFIEGPTLNMLSDIHQKMLSQGNVIVALISLSCWESAPTIEPHTPTPSKRMITIRNLKEIGISTFIAVRPILPNVSDIEYERLIDEGIKAGSDGFILGPLYADEKGRFVRSIPLEVLEKVPNFTTMVSWSAHSPIWTRYEDGARLQRITEMISTKQNQVLLSSADVIEFVQKRKYAYD